MSKNTNLSFLTDFLTADIVNSRVGMNNVSPQATFDVTGTGKFSGILTLGSTVSNGTYTYTLPSATGTLALTSDIPSVSGYVPYTGATQAVNLGFNQLLASTLSINGDSLTGGSYLGFKHSTSVNTGNNGYTSIYTFGTNTIGFKSISGATTKDFSFSMASITPGVPGGRIYTLPDADGTIALTSSLSGYLPLAGGTLTGPLIGTSATFGGDLTLQGSVTRNIKFLDSTNTNLNAQIQYDQISSTSGQLLFGTNNAGTFGTRLTIANTGVGIGVGPSFPLDLLTASSGTFNTIAQFFNNDFTAGNRSYLRVRQQINAGATSSSYFGTGQDTHLYIIANDSARGGDLIINASTGNVGIGIQPVNSFKLDVGGTGRFKVSADRNLAIKYDTNITLSAQADSGGPESLRIYADTFRLYTATSAVGLTERFTISNTGSATFSSSLNLGVIANAADTALFNIKQAGTSYNNGIYLERAGERNGYHIYIGGALDSLTFRRNYFGTQSDVMSLTRDGNVGIGVTPTAGNRFWVVGQDASASNSTFYAQNGSGTPLLFVRNDGNIGIGTTSPLFPLHIYYPPSTSNALINIESTTNYSGFYAKNTSGGLYLAIDNSTGTGFGNGSYSRLIYSTGNYPLDFYTNDAIKMRITSVGNVGIGTINPGNYILAVDRNASAWAVMSIRNLNSTGYSGLHILNDSGTLMGHLGYANASTGASLQDVVFFGSIGSKPVVFTTADTERMRITPVTGRVGIRNTDPQGLLEVGVVNNNNQYGGHFFSTFLVTEGVWTTVFTAPSNFQWNAITEFTWVSSGDFNRSGAAYMRWAYNPSSANLDVVYTLFNNSQNATGSFRRSGNEIQILISGGGGVLYYVQVRIQGSKAA
jgi:hypothetical protein